MAQQILDRWWQFDGGSELSNAVFKAARVVDDSTIERQQGIINAYYHYGDRSAWPSLQGRSFTEIAQRNKVSHNVIANAVDSLVSEVTQTQPRPMAITNGGGWDARQRAEMLTHWWDAEFDVCGVRKIAPQVVRDAVISGLGIMRPYIDWEHKRVRVERVHPLSVLVDDSGCVDVEPRNVYLRRFVDKWQLIQKIKSDDSLEETRREKLILAAENAPPPDPRYWFFDDHRSNTVEVIEAWHLPSVQADRDASLEETDGRHVIVFHDETYVVETYTRDRFPLPVIRPVPPQRGYWGDSLVLRAAPDQRELNTLLRSIQYSMRFHGIPRIYYPKGTVNPAYMGNDARVAVPFTGGSPPIHMTSNSAGSDVYAMVDRYKSWIYEAMGVSEMGANSLKPAGLNSGKAMRIYNDIQSRRFIGFERSYEEAHVWLAEEMVVCMTELAEEESSVDVVYDDGNDRDVIPWSEMNLAEDAYRVRVFPASALPDSPAGRMAMIEEMVESGLVPPEDAFELIADPDFKAITDKVTAPKKLLQRTFTQMLRTGDYRAPEPHMNLTLGIDVCKIRLQEEDLHGAPDERLELLRMWMNDAVDLMQRAEAAMAAKAAEMAPPPAPPPPMPPGGPMPIPPDGMAPMGPGEMPMGPEGMPMPPPDPGMDPPMSADMAEMMPPPAA